MFCSATMTLSQFANTRSSSEVNRETGRTAWCSGRFPSQEEGLLNNFTCLRSRLCHTNCH
jgi:hypothetical protein